MTTDSYAIEYTPTSSRTTLRVTCPHLLVKFSGLKTPFPVENISGGGVCFQVLPTTHQELVSDTTYSVALLKNNETLFSNLLLRMIHVSPPYAGGKFVDLDFRTEALLDKIVLEIQKDEITLKKTTDIRE